ncbi:MAG: DUF4160 domain-containing protein [Duganella sp.]
MTRDEHCPPHVHVGRDNWNARFLFSFCRNEVDLWDVTPVHMTPSASVLEDLRRIIEKSVNLRKARQCWWQVHSGKLRTCLSNKYWDTLALEEVDGKNAKSGMLQIQSESYDPASQRTTLTFVGGGESLEIQL